MNITEKYPIKPIVNTRRDSTQYFNLATINKEKLRQIITAAEKRNPEWLDHITDDPFIEALQKNFNGQILLPMRKKHMIVIFGKLTTSDKTRINKFKKYFEAEVVIESWDGKEEIDDNQTTLIFTESKPPYMQPYNALSIDGAKRLMAA